MFKTTSAHFCVKKLQVIENGFCMNVEENLGVFHICVFVFSGQLQTQLNFFCQTCFPSFSSNILTNSLPTFCSFVAQKCTDVVKKHDFHFKEA